VPISYDYNDIVYSFISFKFIFKAQEDCEVYKKFTLTFKILSRRNKVEKRNELKMSDSIFGASSDTFFFENAKHLPNESNFFWGKNILPRIFS